MIFDQLKYFKRSENFGDPDKMNPDFLLELDNFRSTLSCQIRILCGFAISGHAVDSYHYRGRAVDCRLIKDGAPLSISEHILIAIKAPFGGVGIYTHSPNGPFLHLDNRLATYDRKIWVCEKEGEYQNLSLEFLRKYLNS